MTSSDPKKASEAQGPDGRRPRILFVAEHLPVPVRGGSSQRSNLLIEAMASFADVDLLASGPPGIAKLLQDNGYRVAGIIPPEREDGPIAQLRRLLGFLFPRRLRYRPRAGAARMVRTVREEGHYDVVVGRYCRPSARAGVHATTPAIIDIDDLESQKLSSWIDSHRLLRRAGPAARWLVRRVRVAEREVIAGLSRAWFAAPEDLCGLGADRLDVIPNIPFYPAADLGPSPSDGAVLFVASFDYRVNANALCRLVQTVWPRIRAERPGLRLRIVGGGLDAAWQARLAKMPGIDYRGFVEDLTAEYAGALCSIVPIWEGGGSKIKVLESLALGRSCIVAAPSMRGYGAYLRDGEDVLVAADEDAFVAALLRLAADDDVRHRLEQNGRAAVNMHFSRTVLAARVRASVERALGAQP